MNSISLIDAEKFAALTEKVESRLLKISSPDDLWIQQGFGVPDAMALQTAKEFALSCSQSFHFPAPYLYPLTEGGVVAEWSRGNFEISVSFFNDLKEIEFQAMHLKTEAFRTQEGVLPSSAFESFTSFWKSLSKDSEEVIALQKQIKKAWLEFLDKNEGKTTPAQHAVYALLKNKSLDKAFTPMKSGSELLRNKSRDEALIAAQNLNKQAWLPFSQLLAQCDPPAILSQGNYQTYGCYEKQPSNSLFNKVLAYKA